MGMPLHFLGLRDPLPRCLLGPPLAPLHLASFHPFAPRPRRAAGPCTGPRNPGARIPAPCTAERGQGSCPGTHRQSDRLTDGRTAPDGRAWRALRGPGGLEPDGAPARRCPPAEPVLPENGRGLGAPYVPLGPWPHPPPLHPPP
eukprot:bmy_05439T0